MKKEKKVKKEKAKEEAKKVRRIPLGRSMLGVVLLGGAIGVILAWAEQRASEEEVEAILRKPDELSPVLFPEAPAAVPTEEAAAAVVVAPIRLAAMEGLPTYPGTEPQGFESVVIADEMPIEMARFFTQDSPEQLRTFYEKELKQRGLHPISYEFSPFAGYIGYMDWLNEELHLISYIRQGEQTLVFPSRSRPSVRTEEGKLPAGVPVHPRVSLTKTITFLEPEGRHRISHSATIEGARLSEVADYYREAFLAGGWKLGQEGEEGKRKHMEVSEGGRVLNISFEEEEGSVRLYLLLMSK